MASRRKTFVPKGKANEPSATYAEFMAALLAGRVKAEKLIVTTPGNSGHVKFEYDDPNG